MKFAILVLPGLSCDVDMHHAVTKVVGEDADLIWHLDAEQKLGQYDALLIPSGASYGDYLRPGALAQASPAIESVKAFAASGKPVLGVGNGFQILAEAGLLPGAFLQNKGLKFRTGNAKLAIRNKDSKFTSEYAEGQDINIPFAHQYGNYFVDEETLTELKQTDRIVFTYVEDNHDGSTDAIAGVLNDEGNVLGMMPLPERAVEKIIGGTDGYPLFQSILKNWSENNVSHA
ncbi:phosphoribosylformylglycinamidine synthase subunit PurQ [Sporosarcina sp. FSL W7-1349]|uniref:phosphoribosylformylglycinamidine synthase subunit PurQ n=1 Tax=Sporosarcina sp. FSL W7-1349 TaxID=2921561 RepID=UPI0030FBE97B